MANGIIVSTPKTIKYYDHNIALNSVSWITSGRGKYYTSVDISSHISGKIISITPTNWNSLYVDDIVQPYISDNMKIGIISNKNSFYSSADMTFRCVYIDE